MVISQKAIFSTNVLRLFETLTNSDTFAKATNAPAFIDPHEGGAISCFNNQITGRFLDIVPNERIVQAWRVSAWQPGTFSIVKFSFMQKDDQTELILEQTGFPEEFKTHLEAGWSKMYWEPLNAFLNTN